MDGESTHKTYYCERTATIAMGIRREAMQNIILDLCGGTGAWSQPYREAGYDVRVLTLPEYDVTCIDFNADSEYLCFSRREYTGVTFMHMGVETKEYKQVTQKVCHWHDIIGILAAPTCTMFSLARTTAKTPRDFGEGMELVKACLNIIWRAREEGGVRFWALENPMGYLRQFLGKPALTFDPCDYGDTYTKKTDLWGYFKEPRKSRRALTEDEMLACKMNSRKLPSLPQGYVLPQGWNLTAAKRSMTSAHFANAFFRANNPLRLKGDGNG